MSKYFSTSGNYHTDKRKTSVSFNALLYNKVLFEAVPKCQKELPLFKKIPGGYNPHKIQFLDNKANKLHTYLYM